MDFRNGEVQENHETQKPRTVCDIKRINAELKYIGIIIDIAVNVRLSQDDVKQYYETKNQTLALRNFVSKIESLECHNSDDEKGIIDALLRFNLYEVFELSEHITKKFLDQNRGDLSLAYVCGNYYNYPLDEVRCRPNNTWLGNEKRFIFVNGTKLLLVADEEKQFYEYGGKLHRSRSFSHLIRDLYTNVLFRTKQTMIKMIKFVQGKSVIDDKALKWHIKNHPVYTFKEFEVMMKEESLDYVSEINPNFNLRNLITENLMHQQYMAPQMSQQPVPQTPQQTLSRDMMSTEQTMNHYVRRPVATTQMTPEERKKEFIRNHLDVNGEIEELEKKIKQSEKRILEIEQRLGFPSLNGKKWADVDEELVLDKLEFENLKKKKEEYQLGGKANKYKQKIEKYTHKLNKLSQ